MLDFCEDYTNVMYRFKHSLLLLRGSDDGAVLHDENEMLIGKITLSKLSWSMPHVMASLECKNVLIKMIDNKIKIPVVFCAMQCDTHAIPEAAAFNMKLGIKSGTEKPCWILVGFQTRHGNQTTDPAAFDHLQHIHNAEY